MRQNHSAWDCIYNANVLSLCLGAADSGIVDISFCFLSITLLSARHALMCNRNCSESILKKNFLTFNNMDQANQCASVCKKSKSTFVVGPFAHRWERKEKKRPRVVKSQWSILDIADIVLASPRPASENNLFLVQIFNHIASHLSFNPQHTKDGLGAPHNRSIF